MVLFAEPEFVASAVTAAVEPKLKVRFGAVVTISVEDAVPPILPVKLVRLKLPVALVATVNAEDDVILPAPVVKLIACMVALPRFPEMAMLLEPP